MPTEPTPKKKTPAAGPAVREWHESRYLKACDEVMQAEQLLDSRRKQLHLNVQNCDEAEVILAAALQWENAIRRHMSALAYVYVCRSTLQGLGLWPSPSA